MDEQITTDVLIIGAGPTGLTLACDLARRGLSFRVVDGANGPSTASRAKTIQPRALEVANDLGVIDRVLEAGVVHVPTRHYDRDRVVSEGVEVAVGMTAPGVPYAPLWLSQPRFEAIRGVAELGGRVEWGSAVTGLRQDHDGVIVGVRTAAGTDEIRARYVVGCDVPQHRARRSAPYWRAPPTRTSAGTSVTCASTASTRTAIPAMSPEHGILSLFPLPGTDIWQFQASIPADDLDPARPSLELFRRIFAERAGVPGVDIKDTDWLSLYKINVCLADRYRVGRVFLAGDAAHVHSPAGGQGMNTGIQDAYNLGWKLAAVLDGADATLLDTYEQERRPSRRPSWTTAPHACTR